MHQRVMAEPERIPVFIVIDREWPQPMEDPIVGVSRDADQAEQLRGKSIADELGRCEFESDEDREETEDELDRRFFIVKLAV